MQNKSYLLKIRGGVEVDSAGKKAGKGPLIAEEISHTLGTSQDQYLFQAVEEKSPTITARCGTGGNNVPAVVFENHAQDSRYKGPLKVAQPVTATYGMGGNNQPLVICLQGNGIDRADTAVCNGKGWTEDVSYTLNTIDRPAVAYCIGNGQVHDAVQMEKEICKTLNCMGDPMKVMIRK